MSLHLASASKAIKSTTHESHTNLHRCQLNQVWYKRATDSIPRVSLSVKLTPAIVCRTVYIGQNREQKWDIATLHRDRCYYVHDLVLVCVSSCHLPPTPVPTASSSSRNHPEAAQACVSCLVCTKPGVSSFPTYLLSSPQTSTKESKGFPGRSLGHGWATKPFGDEKLLCFTPLFRY